MEFNKINRGAKRAANEEASIYAILDAGFLCHVAYQHQGQSMIIPTAYGRIDDVIYLHGSTKNFMLNQLLDGQTCCISVTHLDGIVLARSLFDTSANYRSAVIFGKAVLVTEENERIEGLKAITDNIVAGRWEEVPIGNENQLKATMVVKIKIDTASAKIRDGGPAGDDAEETVVWSGHIPMKLVCTEPVFDAKFGEALPQSASVKGFLDKYK